MPSDDIDAAIDKIQEILMKKKGKFFKDYLDKVNKNTRIEPVNNEEEEAREKNAVRIKTNTVLDEIMGGGLPEGKSVLLYGEFGSGKTQTVFTATALCKDLIIYIDPEDSFSFERLKQICDTRHLDYEDVKKRIILFKPKDWVEQLLILTSIGSPMDYDKEYDGKKVALIICDSLSCFFRGIEFSGRQTLSLKTGFLREFMVDLKRLAREHRSALIFTSQVSEEPVASAYTSKADTQHPLGGHSIAHQPDFVIFFRKGSGNVRVVRMIDSSHEPLAEKAFVINEKGIDDLPPETKAAKTYKKGEEKFEKKQQQEIVGEVEKEEKSEETEDE
jgi:RecA/RadA recombinase